MSNRTPRPLIERFWEKVDWSGDCWTWTAAQNSSGYGNFFIRKTPTGVSILTPAHRWSYEWFVGPIPDELHVDHLCRNRTCVNPAHLEAVTQTENNRRSAAGRRGAPRQLRAECARGHSFTPENTLIMARSDRPGSHRQCRACKRQRQAKSRAARRA